MKKFFLDLAKMVLGAAIIASVGLLWKLNERVSRIEYRLGIVASVTQK